MDNTTSHKLDTRLMALLDAEQFDAATEIIIKEHGPWVFGMISGVFYDHATAHDVFQRFSIELWRSLPLFKRESAVSTWVFTLARRAISWQLRRPERRREERLETADACALPERRQRTMTEDWRKTEVKSRFRRLCEDLAPEDRTLVMLRIGQKMSWNTIADVVHDGALDDASRKRKAAALRKRFERIKNKMRAKMAGASL